jgi:hypothetical protein
MADRGGFIVLWRKALDGWLFDLPEVQFKVTIRILLEANWRDSTAFRKGQQVTIRRGQALLSEAALKCEIVTLVPARTDTRAFRALVRGAAAVCFWRGRITFRGAAAGAPFPSAIVYHGWRPERFVEVFADAGLIWRVR